MFLSGIVSAFQLSIVPVSVFLHEDGKYYSLNRHYVIKCTDVPFVYRDQSLFKVAVCFYHLVLSH